MKDTARKTCVQTSPLQILVQVQSRRPWLPVIRSWVSWFSYETPWHGTPSPRGVWERRERELQMLSEGKMFLIFNDSVMTILLVGLHISKSRVRHGGFSLIMYLIHNEALGAFWVALCVASSRTHEFQEWLRSAVGRPCGKSGFGLQQPSGWSCVPCMFVVWMSGGL